uniref:Uncharacterized protein n=1 Tax=Cajanus cajan TaxID=3821 RepID=A0A151UCG1_CAJCA|nr:hypothetical protein KK1_021163 [Cajanus cajan]
MKAQKLNYSTFYHLQIDGPTKVANQSLKAYLFCFASGRSRFWFAFLHIAKY